MLLSVLALCGVLGGGCTDRPMPPMPPLAQRLPWAMAPDSIRIEYVCGNGFRVLNYDNVFADVTWDVAETADSGGRAQLPPRFAGQPYSVVNITTRLKGTMRLFSNGRLIQTMANGGSACPPNPFLTLLDSVMPEKWRKLSDDEKGWAMLTMAAVMNDPLVRFGRLGPLSGPARILYDSLVAGNEAMLDSASANLGFDRLGCLEDRARATLGFDSVSRIGREAEEVVREKHTRAEWQAGEKGIEMLHPVGDLAFCRRVDSLWYARAAKLRKARR